MRSTEAVVDLGAIGRNVERLVTVAAPAALCAVTKADAYGHGLLAASRVALDAGATMLAVALVEEGIELRENGVRAPILLLSEPRPNEMFEVVAARLTPTVYTPDGIAALVAAAGFDATAGPVDVHLNIDTGMNRVGLPMSRPAALTEPAQSHIDEIAAGLHEALQAIGAKPDLRLAGVWTHFAVADEPDNPYTDEQLGRFHRALRVVRDELGDRDDLLVHASNSAGLINRPDAHFDMVRTGIAMYGIAPSAALAGIIELEPAMELRTQLGLVKPVRAGDRISYGLRHTFDSDTVVGTIPIGYADGLRRDSFARGAAVLVGGERRRIVGTVTMDQAMVDLGRDSSAAPGDDVILVGSQGPVSITASDRAQDLGTIPYEIVCDVGRRVRRRYV